MENEEEVEEVQVGLGLSESEMLLSNSPDLFVSLKFCPPPHEDQDNDNNFYKR